MPTFHLLRQVESDASGKETVFICNWMTGATCLGKTRKATMGLIRQFLHNRPAPTITSWETTNAKVSVQFENGNRLVATLWEEDQKYDWLQEGF